MRRSALFVAGAALVAAVVFFTTRIESEPVAAGDFVHFESGHVHPAALSPDGQRLFVVNTPDMRLSVFSLSGGVPVLEKEIPVGLEPVSVAARTNNEVWVVNHLSDDISVVDVAAGNVVRTIRTGDEPTDVVFAGPDRRAFVCVSQENAVKVFDPANPGAAPVVIPIDGSDPRALSVNGDSSQVYVTVLESGNQTTVVPFQEVQANGGLPPPNPPMTGTNQPAPVTALIVKWDGAAWRDEINRNWNSFVPYTLHDKDLFVLNAATRTVQASVRTTGTVNFNAAWNPGNGLVYVTNTDARNEVRFEPNLKGNFIRNRVTRVNPATATVVDRVHLNPHINYAVVPGSQAEIDQSLSQPLDLTWNAAGSRGYLAAFGSGKLGVIDANGTVVNRIAVGGGPTGVTLDAGRNRLYVVNRFDNTVSVVDLGSESQTAVVPIGKSGFDPTPADVKAGRAFQYDARLTSGHGDASCGSCHVFSNFDALAWDLGDPTGRFVPVGDPEYPSGQIDPFLSGFHPMKGPMTTQTMRGIDITPPLHWRGDRINLGKFNPAFVGLLGRGSQLGTTQLNQYMAFVNSIRYGPNPFQNLDRTFPNPSSGPSAQRGFLTFVNDPHDGGLTCEQCHTLNPGTNGQIINKNALQETQDMLVPHLRNMYEKTGFRDSVGAINQKGFGFIHDGAVDNLFTFLKLPVFQFSGDAQRRDMEAYLLAFDTGTAPAVGHQVTVTGTNKNDAAIVNGVNLLLGQANDGSINLIAKGVLNGQQRGWALNGAGLMQPDRAGEAAVSVSTLRGMAQNGGEITFTGMPIGSGARAGVDRDRDGHFDRDELDFGSDPADPASFPGAVAVGPGPSSAVRFAGPSPNPFRGATELRFAIPRAGEVRLALYDLRGREVRELARGQFPAGEHALRFDGRDGRGASLGAGVYFARFEFAGEKHNRPLVLIR